jgi:MFS family permease
VALSSNASADAAFSNLSPEQRARNAAAKRVIFFTVFLDLLGFGVIIPQLGVYAAQFGATPLVVGVLASTYSTMGFLFTPFWGRLSDRIGRRPVMLYSIFGTALGYVLFAFSHSMPLLFASRIVDGITGGNISVAQAYLSDITPPEERSKTFGLFGAVFGVGFAMGPAVGAALSHLPGVWGGNLGIGLFTAALSFLNWAMAMKRLPETLSPEIRAQNVKNDAGKKVRIINVDGFRRAFALPGLGLIITISLFITIAFATLQGTYTLFLITRYNRPAAQQLIRTNPQAAIAEARRDAGQTGETSLAGGGEGGAGGELEIRRTASGEVEPYPASMGGDFDYAGYPAPADFSWRHIEKTLVRPRASRLAAILFAGIGIVALLVQGGLIGPLKKRFGEIKMVLAGTLLMALGLALVPLHKMLPAEFSVMALLAFGNSIATPILTALVSELSPENERGEVMGVFQSVASLGRIIGPNVGGLFFHFFSSGAPYWAGAVIMSIAFMFALRLKDALPSNEGESVAPTPLAAES